MPHPQGHNFPPSHTDLPGHNAMHPPLAVGHFGEHSYTKLEQAKLPPLPEVKDTLQTLYQAPPITPHIPEVGHGIDLCISHANLMYMRILNAFSVNLNTNPFCVNGCILSAIFIYTSNNGVLFALRVSVHTAVLESVLNWFGLNTLVYTILKTSLAKTSSGCGFGEFDSAESNLKCNLDDQPF